MPELHFKVDSHLLRELGERLVGQPHIALAELVKNSYDADATEVVIRFEEGSIEISDNGHGMSYEDFKEQWLRIGTTHKQRQQHSPKFGRSLTGSKGVGRLAVQLLAGKTRLRSVTPEDTSQQVYANVDWDEAVEAGLLTKAPVHVDEVPSSGGFPGDSGHGTEIVLTDLKNEWDADAFESLAREIWPLQPPFRGPDPDIGAFNVRLESPHEAAVEAFDAQMEAVLDLWTARLVGHLLPTDHEPEEDEVHIDRPTRSDDSGQIAKDLLEPSGVSRWPDRSIALSLEMGGQTRQVTYRMPNCHLTSLEFEVRVFKLQYRQPHGITVGTARNYLNQFGGVHVYDGGFHLPYYGPDQDWLHIEMDHSHRRSASSLLPQSLQVQKGLQHLPTNSRLFGIVRVDTRAEQQAAESISDDATRDALAIQVTRDRLTSNAAYTDLVTIVRWAIDYYAHTRAREAFKEKVERDDVAPPPSSAVDRVREVLEDYSQDIPEDVRSELEEEVQTAVDVARSAEERTEARLGLMAALATTGIAALALEHETAREHRTLERALKRLEDVASQKGDSDLKQIAEELRQWLTRSKQIRRVFTPLLSRESRERQAKRFTAKALAQQVIKQTTPIVRGCQLEAGDIPEDLLLPPGSYAEWAALFQNLIVNAANATLDQDERRVVVTGESNSKQTRRVFVHDTGVGIDLDTAEELFEPFERRLEVSPARRGLVVGGSGLGLTIVRMLADTLNCRVRFVAPHDDFATTAEISWREKA